MTELRERLAKALQQAMFGDPEWGMVCNPERLADAVLALPGVAIVALPDADDPDTWEYSGGTHSWTVPNGDDCSEDEQVFTSRHGDVEIGLDRYTPDDARQLAAALLAAANAAEGRP